MQATQYYHIPVKFPAVIKIPTVSQVRSPTTLFRAISIPKPDDALSSQVLEDSVAAYWDYQFLFVSQRSETVEPVTLRAIDGSIPRDFPTGTYYLAGPGLFKDDHGSTVHPLDGHGYLRAFTINGINGRVDFMAKYVKTEAQVEELDPVTGTWRFTHRGPFSVLRGGKKIGNTKVMKNVANTSVLRWGGRLLCMWEGGDPHAIESGTLNTMGLFDMTGDCNTPVNTTMMPVARLWDLAARLLKPILHGVFKMPPKRLLSHYKIDARRNRLLTMSCNAEDMLLPNSQFTFYEYDSNFKLLQRQEFSIPDHLMIHDWAFTESYYILFANRIKLDLVGSITAVCGLSPMITALSLNPSKPTSPIYLLPRFPEGTPMHRDWKIPVEVPSQLWLLHTGNAFEETDGNANSQIQIQCSCCSYRWFDFHKLFGYDCQSGKLDPAVMNAKAGEEETLPHLVQVSIELDANGDCQKCAVEPLNKWAKPTDFPVINPIYSGRKNRYVYGAGSSGTRQALPHFPFDTVVKLDTVNKSVTTTSVGNRRYIGEPIFVPKGVEEDDGYLLVVEYAVSVQRCYLLILDPKKIGEANAVEARFEVPKHLNFPLGFHGFWARDS